MAHIHDRGPEHGNHRYQGNYRAPDGKEKSKTFRRKIDAQRWIDENTAGIVTGSWTDPRAGRITLEEYAAEWLDVQTFDVSTREGTERRLRLHILPTLGQVQLRNLKASTIRSWLHSVESSAPSSVRVMLVNLSAILATAVDDGRIATNPCDAPSVKAPKIEKRLIIPWTIATAQDVIEAHPIAYRAVPVLGAGCGLRQGEVLGLRVDDVDFLHRRVLVRRQVKIVAGVPMLAPPKGKTEREVPLPDIVATAVAEHLRLYPSPDGQVFRWRDGALIHRTYFNNRVWKPALVRAGMKPIRENGMHALRHHYASVLLDGGVSIRALSEYLGHADPGFTLRVYAHLMPDTEDRARMVVDLAHSPAESPRNETGAIAGIVN